MIILKTVALTMDLTLVRELVQLKALALALLPLELDHASIEHWAALFEHGFYNTIL